MNFTFTAKIWQWRGPAPYYFVTVPPDQSDAIKAIAPSITYGWGVIPVTVHAGKTTWKTSLFPKDGSYLVPLKDSVRKAEKLHEGDEVTLRLDIG